VWIAAALGIACGVADWLVAAAGLVLALVILIVLKKLEKRFTREPEHH
jgi:putative Mg2+ transporter-C (MgtC) family protein